MQFPSRIIDAWFARIGYDGPREASLDVLNGIVCAHVSSVPFENLDVLLGRPIRLDPESVAQKLLDDRRGGYCFEQNSFLLWGLESLGFSVRPLSARVRIQRPRDFTPPRTHLFVRVDPPFEGSDGASWLADVGVGGLSPTGAIRLVEDVVQPTPHESRRLIRVDGRWFHQALLGAEWADICEFTLEEMPEIDRVIGNWYTSTHPDSNFRNRLLVARAGPGGSRITLLNRELTVRGPDGVGQTTEIPDPDALLGVLDGRFGLRLPAGTRFPILGY